MEIAHVKDNFFIIEIDPVNTTAGDRNRAIYLNIICSLYYDMRIFKYCFHKTDQRCKKYKGQYVLEFDNDEDAMAFKLAFT